MEYERTKRIRTKERVNFTIDRGIASQFKKFCKEQGYNMSTKVDQAIWAMVQKGKRTCLAASNAYLPYS